jgi:hypothetical protein
MNKVVESTNNHFECKKWKIDQYFSTISLENKLKIQSFLNIIK